MTKINLKILILGDRTIKCFLENDCCCILADNYLLAITCIYFIRANLPSHSYDAQHFFSAL